MAWWEWIPGVSTYGHAMADPKGRKTIDYAACATTPADCAALAPVAIAKCNNSITTLMLKYIGDWIGFPLPADFFKAAGGLTLSLVAYRIAKEVAKKEVAKKAAAAATGIGAVITIDGFADAGIVITKAVQIYKAAQAARAIYCVCPPPAIPPVGGGAVGGGSGGGAVGGGSGGGAVGGGSGAGNEESENEQE